MALAEDVLAFRPRCAEWTESVAVASHAFTTGIQDQPGPAGRCRKVDEADAEGGWGLREECSLTYAILTFICPPEPPQGEGGLIPTSSSWPSDLRLQRGRQDLPQNR